jgi:hypothetical protein
MESLIGKKYYPVDNSYEICLTDRKEYYSLAGNSLNPAKQPEECEIISEPFRTLIQSDIVKDSVFERHMILVKCPRGYTHATLFDEQGFTNRENKPSTFLLSQSIRF